MKVIITGATGMVGKAVLLECLSHPQVEKILIINRKPIGLKHPKLLEIIHKDFTDFSSISDKLQGYDVCLHCMGVSAVGLSEESYIHITYTMTKALAEALYNINNNMVFNYVSGTGTDSSETGRTMWARVKGKTENMILNMGFKDAYAFRPGIILPEKGIKSGTGWYNAFYKISKPIFPLLRKMKHVTTTTKVGKAMINSVLFPQSKKHLENNDINMLSAKQ